MYCVTVTFNVKPDQFENFMKFMVKQSENSLALEADCFQFDVWTNADKPNEVFLYETYKSRAAFDIHLASDHFKEFDTRVAPMLKSKTVETFDRIHKS